MYKSVRYTCKPEPTLAKRFLQLGIISLLALSLSLLSFTISNDEAKKNTDRKLFEEEKQDDPMPVNIEYETDPLSFSNFLLN